MHRCGEKQVITCWYTCHAAPSVCENRTQPSETERLPVASTRAHGEHRLCELLRADGRGALLEAMAAVDHLHAAALHDDVGAGGGEVGDGVGDSKKRSGGGALPGGQRAHQAAPGCPGRPRARIP